jgi:3-oxoacyl-[acyl-carrier protein] reductase
MSSYLEQQFGLRGKRALVTGAGRGIGRSVALALASAGAEVAVHYFRSGPTAGEVVKQIQNTGGRAWSVCADLTQSEAVAEMFRQLDEHWSGLDILVNNSGDLYGRSTLADIPDDQLDATLRVNLHSTLLTTRAAVPRLSRGQQPVIVNTTSIAAHNGGVNGVSVYAAAKGGILSLTRSLAKELAPQIRVNAISPGVILTDLHRIHSKPAKLEEIAKNTPLQRNGSAEDCAAAVVFLCGPGASFITGDCIEINGGLWMA